MLYHAVFYDNHRKPITNGLQRLLHCRQFGRCSNLALVYELLRTGTPYSRFIYNYYHKVLGEKDSKNDRAEFKQVMKELTFIYSTRFHDVTI